MRQINKFLQNLINKFAYKLCGHTPYRTEKQIPITKCKTTYPQNYNPTKMDYNSILRKV